MIEDKMDKSFQQRREELLKSRLIPKVCPYCKSTKNPSDALFCNECGSILNILPVKAPKGVEAIDLGLPSGTRWANMNVGATRPEEYGSYFAWGEVEEKEEYSVRSYTHYENPFCIHDLAESICGTPYDVAYMKWGGNWRMPSFEQILELIDNCTFKWVKLNGINGAKFTSKINKNWFFLPAAGGYVGYWEYLERGYVGDRGYYWSGTRYPNQPFGEWAHYLSFGERGHWVRAGFYNASTDRHQGFSVRPVYISSSYMKRRGGDVFNEMPGGHLLKENSEQQDGE